MTEDESLRIMQRGARAKQILGDEFVTDAFESLRAHYYSAISMSRPSDVETREAAYRFLKTIDDFEAQFSFAIEEGHVAATYWERYVADQRQKKSRRKA
jgi:hypothetical protein